MKLSQVCDKAIEYGFYLLFFLAPMMMTPFNYELFEFNKMLLVYFLTTIIVSAWLIKMVIFKKFIFKRSFLDLPLLFFFFSQFASTIFSIDRHTSLWGYYSRFHGGLLSTIAYLLLYWAFVSNLGRSKTLSAIRYTLISGALVAAYGIAEHFGIDAQYWVQDVRNRVFSSLGQPNWLAAYLVALIPITWAFMLNSNFELRIKNKEIKKMLFIIPYSLFIILFLCLLYTKSRSGLLGFGVAYLIFWGLILIPKILRKPKAIKSQFAPLKPFFLVTIVIFLISLLVGTPWTPSLGQILSKSPAPVSSPFTAPPPVPGGGTESGEIRKIVWKGAIEIWKHWPLFGSGVETFAYSYYNFRPREHNDVSEWDFLYNKAHNEYLNFAATTGTVGLLAYLIVIGTFLWCAVRREVTLLSEFVPKFPAKGGESKKNLALMSEKGVTSTLLAALLAGYASILITNFFGFSVVVVALLFFLFPAMSVVLFRVGEQKSKGVKLKTELNHGQHLAIALILLFTFSILFSLGRIWYADALFAKGDKFNQAKQYNTAFNYLQRAVVLRPSEPFYHDALSLAAANLASLAFQQNQATLSAELAELAISESDQALKISPNHLNFWKNRTRVFYILAEIDESYNLQALASLQQAVELAPTDAKVFYNFGLIYAQVGQDETAIKTLEKTIELKPNYRDARYALALFYEQKGDLKEARHQLEYILEKINPEDETIKEKLESL